METITLKINIKSKKAKVLKDLIDIFSSEPNSGVEIVEEKSPYNSNSESKTKRVGKEKKGNTDDLWADL